MRRLLPLALLAPAVALGADPQHLTWDLTFGAQKVGTREVTVTFDQTDGRTTRTFEAFTRVDATIGTMPYQWRQRLTFVALDDPASFTSVIDDNGARELVQVGWAGDGWRVTLADKAGVRTEKAAPYRIDLSTADLFDQGSHHRLAGYDVAKVISAETGDVWEGRVEALGPSTVQVAGQPVDVQGWAWWAPEGRHTYWYDADGWLVRFETRLFGQVVAGTLTALPPRSADGFRLDVDEPPVQTSEL